MDHSQLRMALEACRPDSGDLDLPELAAAAECLATDAPARQLFDRIQRIDRRIAEAAHDVPVPAGLAARILARIEANDAAPAGENTAAPTVTPAAAPIARRRFGKWTWSAIAVAASLLLAVSLAVFWPRERALTIESLLNDSSTWYTQLWNDGGWVPLAPQERGLAKYPVAGAIRVTPRRWLDVSSAVGETAVAYDLTAGGHRAALFVIPARDAVAGPTPPLKPPFNTGGLMVGCWQSQGMIYVLVVEGDERAYRNLLESVTQPPLA